MNDDRKRFWLNAFHVLSQVWPWLEPSVDRIRVWDAALADLSTEELQEGLSRVIANHSGSQPPTPGEIRDGAFGKLTWRTVRHQVDGHVMGKVQERTLDPATAPAPVAVHRLLKAGDPQVAALIERLSAKMRPR